MNNITRYYISDLDIAYIGVINPGHVPLTKLMLNAGKHVLCEKPMCLNLHQAMDLFQLAKEKNRFLMEVNESRFMTSMAILNFILQTFRS